MAWTNFQGYRQMRIEGSRRKVMEHTLIAEKALGRQLDKRNEVHHVDGNRSNNAPNNLVICENHAYHKLLHARLRVLQAGGDPNIGKICSGCKLVKPKTDFYVCRPTRGGIKRGDTDGLNFCCKRCNIERAREQARAKQLNRKIDRIPPLG